MTDNDSEPDSEPDSGNEWSLEVYLTNPNIDIPSGTRATLEELAKRINLEEQRAIGMLLSAYGERDPLTGLYNRGKYDRDLRMAIKTVNKRTLDSRRTVDRDPRNVSLIMLDLDYFKAYNDNYGHATGDEVLRQVASTLMGTLRGTNDLAYRLGGEEFAVIADQTDIEQGTIVANRLLDRIRKITSPVWGHVTASIGVVNYVGHVNVQPTINTAVELMNSYADRAMYRAKEFGRNRVIVYSPNI